MFWSLSPSFFSEFFCDGGGGNKVIGRERETIASYLEKKALVFLNPAPRHIRESGVIIIIL